MQEEVEGRNVSKVKICFSGETPGYTDLSLDGDTRGDFRSHNKEVVFHAGMDNFHRRVVAGVAVTVTHASAILTVKRDKKGDISLSVSIKDRKYRSDRMASRIVADIIKKEKTTQQLSFANKQLDTMKHVSMPRTILSENRHCSTTAEDLSERWGLSISQAALTLKGMTQNLIRSAIMPLARRYRAYWMFHIHRIHGTMSTDTMDARCQSIHDEKYYQVFGNKQFFAVASTIKKKSDCQIGLDKFFREYREPDKMTYDGAQEQIRRKTEFQRVMRKYENKGHGTEKNGKTKM